MDNLFRRIINLFHRTRIEQDVETELNSHI